MKEYYCKSKNKEILTNCIKIIIIFTIVQIVGITLAFKFFSHSLTMTLISVISMNIVAYHAVLK